MPNLTRRQASFVRLYIESGDSKKAALEAGYAEASAHIEGARMLRRPHVRAEIERGLVEAFVEDGPIARAALVAICRDGKSEQARVLAATRLLDRAIGPIEQVRRLIVHDERSDDDLRSAIAARLAANPELAALLSGAPVIDGTASRPGIGLQPGLQASGQTQETPATSALPAPSASDRMTDALPNRAGSGTP